MDHSQVMDLSPVCFLDDKLLWPLPTKISPTKQQSKQLIRDYLMSNKLRRTAWQYKWFVFSFAHCIAALIGYPLVSHQKTQKPKYLFTFLYVTLFPRVYWLILSIVSRNYKFGYFIVQSLQINVFEVRKPVLRTPPIHKMSSKRINK